RARWRRRLRGLPRAAPCPAARTARTPLPSVSNCTAPSCRLLRSPRPQQHELVHDWGTVTRDRRCLTDRAYACFATVTTGWIAVGTIRDDAADCDGPRVACSFSGGLFCLDGLSGGQSWSFSLGGRKQGGEKCDGRGQD